MPWKRGKSVRRTVKAHDLSSAPARSRILSHRPLPLTWPSHCVIAAGAGAVRKAVAGGVGPRAPTPPVAASRAGARSRYRTPRVRHRRLPLTASHPTAPYRCHSVRAAGSGAACGEEDARESAFPPPPPARVRDTWAALERHCLVYPHPPPTPLVREGGGRQREFPCSSPGRPPVAVQEGAVRTRGWREPGGREKQEAHTQQDDRRTRTIQDRNRDASSSVTFHQRPVRPAACP